MKTKHKIIGWLLIIYWLVLLWRIFYVGDFLLNNSAEYFSTYIIIALSSLFWYSIIVINYFDQWR